MFWAELIERSQPIINFTHTTAFSMILCAGWFLTFIIMSINNGKMRKQCDNLLLENRGLKRNLDEINLINQDLEKINYDLAKKIED